MLKKVVANGFYNAVRGAVQHNADYVVKQCKFEEVSL